MAWSQEECKLAREGLAFDEAHLKKLEQPPITSAKIPQIKLYKEIVTAMIQLIAENCVR